MLWCSIQPIRERKSRMVMEALCAGWKEPAQCIEGDPPDDGNPFAIYGQIWGAERLLPNAIKQGRPFWYIDNGFWKPGRGSPDGYYRICYRSMMPIHLGNVSDERVMASGIRMRPWRSKGKHILFALPGLDYGMALGLDMAAWIDATGRKLRKRTERPIVVRERDCKVPLALHMENCWAVVTHSSNVAVDAVIAGVPVFVAEGAAAAPVGNTDLDKLENPRMPDRDVWWASLMCQQFTPAEMVNGTAFRHLVRVRDQVDGVLAA